MSDDPIRRRVPPLNQPIDMGMLILWALLTGGITGGVWVSIVLLGNHAQLRREQRELGAEVEARRAELARLEARMAQMERQLPGGSA